MVAKFLHDVLDDLDADYGAYVPTVGGDLSKGNTMDKAFEASKGGTPFIDEAYLLMDSRAANGRFTGVINGDGPKMIIIAGYQEELGWATGRPGRRGGSFVMGVPDLGRRPAGP